MGRLTQDIIAQINRLCQKLWLLAPGLPGLLALLLGWALVLVPLAAHGLREDEALYAGWTLKMAQGNPLLIGIPLDKPPLYLLLLAGWQWVAGSGLPGLRLLDCGITLLNLALLTALAKRLAGPRAAWVAAAFYAASPFTILFAPTLYIDPLLTFWFLLACLAGLHRRWGWLGLSLGLALATKQQALILLPLPLALGGVPDRRGLSRLAAGATLPLLLLAGWDAARLAQTMPGGPPDLWTQSAVSYGGIGLAAPLLWPLRSLAWLQQAQYVTGFAPLSALLVAALALPFLPPRGAAPAMGRQPALRLLAVFVLAYPALHVVIDFQVWDRYLLPLIPLAAVLMAAGLVRLAARWGPWLILAGLLCLVPPALTAAASGYPVGSDHGAYDGIEAAARYVRQVLPDDNRGVLYHHWLGWHWDYYLADTHFQRIYYPSPAFLAADAVGPGDYRRLIVMPAWHDEQPLRAALAARGLALVPRFETHRADGTLSFTVYAILPRSGAGTRGDPP